MISNKQKHISDTLNGLILNDERISDDSDDQIDSDNQEPQAS